MRRSARHLALAVCALPCLLASPPAALVSALEHLRDQKSFRWEVINSDPGPVSHQFETRRGTVTTVVQSNAPNMKGVLDRNGDMLIQREWPDGLRLDSVIAADGTIVTKTPEGWLTDREILTAQAEERMRGQTPTPRFQWLRRADRPDVRRPDLELAPLLKSTHTFESTGDGYVVRIRSRSGDPAKPNDDDSEPATTVTVTMNLRAGVIRDYEVKLEGISRVTRARVPLPVSDQRIVILTYLPVTRIDIPEEAREKLKAARTTATARTQ
ncbi:MAG: hypothetical protein JNK23_05130 [Opitutaceae bacterium]|nr:hypothetical protein [Opitutaceae bacterium]